MVCGQKNAEEAERLMQKINEYLSDSNCERAQKVYISWKEFAKTSDAVIERRIKECKEKWEKTKGKAIVSDMEWEEASKNAIVEEWTKTNINTTTRSIPYDEAMQLMQQYETSTSATYDKGVVINGVIWATRNVGSSGRFASNPEDYGNYYSWDEAKNVCPKGWRLPTQQEIQSLVNTKSIWTTINGIYGRLWGSSNNTLFLPVAGYRYRTYSNGVLDYAGTYGYYWSSTEYKNVIWYALHINSDSAGESINNCRDGLSVRCVAE